MGLIYNFRFRLLRSYFNLRAINVCALFFNLKFKINYQSNAIK